MQPGIDPNDSQEDLQDRARREFVRVLLRQTYPKVAQIVLPVDPKGVLLA